MWSYTAGSVGGIGRGRLGIFTGCVIAQAVNKRWQVAAFGAAGALGHAHRHSDHTRVVWAPHHSYSPHWLNFGTFAQMYIEDPRFKEYYDGRVRGLAQYVHDAIHSQ